MSDISKSSSSSSSKRRIHQIDDTIEYLTHEVKKLEENFVYKTEFECSLMAVKLKREKVKALSAAARSQVLLADMDVLIAESDLFADIERLKNLKKIKLDRGNDENKSQTKSSKETPAATTNAASVQTTSSQTETKKKRKHSSSKRSLVDISSDETVLIPTIYKSTASHVETSQKLQTSFPSGMLNKSLENKSDSEVSLSSSIRAEFSEPYTKTQAPEPDKKVPKKNQKSDKKLDSKCLSKLSKPKPTESPTKATKTVADLKKSIYAPSSHAVLNSSTISTPKNSRPNSSDRNAAATTSAYVPIRHNMPAIITQPNVYVTHPSIYVNPDTQKSMQHHSQRGNSQAYHFYGSNK